eukprot:jgi/Bigna1/67409/fgenesh1_pg.3_\
MKIGGYDVDFPFKPYPSQLAFMSKVAGNFRWFREYFTKLWIHQKVLCAISSCENALLESPTGTGKSLALLCSSLAWLRVEKAKKQDKNSQEEVGGSDSQENIATQRKKTKARIFFATRTHSQIAQIIRELRTTNYRPEMTILGSRDRYCINKKVRAASQGGNLSEECEETVKQGSCRFFFQPQYRKLKGKMRKSGKESMEVWDIEDLVEFGKKHKACPYYASRLIFEHAELVFCPYNYLIDPLIRDSMDLDLNDAVLIFDEAHNIEDIARDGTSGKFNIDVLQEAIKALQIVIDDAFHIGIHAPLKKSTQSVVNWLIQSESLLGTVGYEHEQLMMEGPEASMQLEGLQITTETTERMKKLVDRSATESSKAENKEVGLPSAHASVLTGLYVVLDFMLRHPQEYKVVFSKKSAQEQQPGRRRRRRGRASSNGKRWNYTLQIWCMNPAVAFREVSHMARSVILTSGTLAPLDSFACELGAVFKHRLEARHLIPKENVLARVVSRDANGKRLVGTFKHTSKYSYQDSIGEIVLNICTAVPEGVLVFFPSYKLLETICERWKDTELWHQIRKEKVICVESRDSSKNSNFELSMKTYKSAVAKGSDGKETTGIGSHRIIVINASYTLFSVFVLERNYRISTQLTSSRGAVFLGVCRGKISEGIDFSDGDARAVLIVGIPYPNLKDQQIVAKRAYNDRVRRETPGSKISGGRWYELQAFRAVNQAIGRCIRHKRGKIRVFTLYILDLYSNLYSADRSDYGAIFLIDKRFEQNNVLASLSRWFRTYLRSGTSLKTSSGERGTVVAGEIRRFFETKTTAPRRAGKKTNLSCSSRKGDCGRGHKKCLLPGTKRKTTTTGKVSCRALDMLVQNAVSVATKKRAKKKMMPPAAKEEPMNFSPLVNDRRRIGEIARTETTHDAQDLLREPAETNVGKENMADSFEARLVVNSKIPEKSENLMTPKLEENTNTCGSDDGCVHIETMPSKPLPAEFANVKQASKACSIKSEIPKKTESLMKPKFEDTTRTWDSDGCIDVDMKPSKPRLTNFVKKKQQRKIRPKAVTERSDSEDEFDMNSSFSVPRFAHPR